MKNWKKELKKVDGTIGLLYVCPNCKKDFLLSPDDLEHVGTPICNECDIDTNYSSTVIMNNNGIFIISWS